MREDILFSSTQKGVVVEVPFRYLGRCSGMQNLLQKVTLLLLTNTNDPGRSYGGNLSGLAGRVNAGASLESLFSVAASDVASVLKEEQRVAGRNLPDDETLSSLAVDKVEKNGKDGYNVGFTVTSLTGETGGLTIPLST